MKNSIRKTFLLFIAIILLAPALFFASAKPAQAFVLLGDVQRTVKWLGDIVLFGLENAAYMGLKTLSRAIAEMGANQLFEQWATGEKGKLPTFETLKWDKFMINVGESAVGGAIDGVVMGVEHVISKETKGKKLEEEAKKLGEDAAPDLQLATDVMNDKFGGTGDIGKMQNEADTYNQTWKENDCENLLKIMGPMDNKTQDRAKICSQTKENLYGSREKIGVLNEIESWNKFYKNLDEKLVKKRNANAAFDQWKVSERDRLFKYQKNKAGAFSPTAYNFIKGVCAPNLNIALKIGISLGANIGDVEPPLCEFKKLSTNWSSFIKNTGAAITKAAGTSGWQFLANTLDPYKSDIGVTFGLQTSAMQDIIDKAKSDEMKRWETMISGGLNPVTDRAGNISTPAGLSKTISDNIFGDVIKKDPLTGKLIADTADLIMDFVGTFAGKSFKLAFDGIRRAAEGVGGEFDVGEQGESGASTSRIYNSDAAPPSYGGSNSAVVRRIARLVKMKTSSGQILNVLSEFQIRDCNASPNACVLGSEFASAIQKRLTVSQALQEYRQTGGSSGLNPDGVFGFKNPSPGIPPNQPDYLTDYPYNSMVILRKYRVLPVAWELAALYIRDHPNQCGARDCTLQDIVNAYDNQNSPFFRLIDPNWVLKLPPVRCELKGYGPAVLDSTKQADGAVKDKELEPSCISDTNGDGFIWCGDTPKPVGMVGDEKDLKIKLSPRQEVCVDEVSCLSDDTNGKCEQNSGFGYCLEERKKFVLQGTKCDSQFATCDALTDVTPIGAGKSFSLLKNTIKSVYGTKEEREANVCTEYNAGCMWFSSERRQYEACVIDIERDQEGNPKQSGKKVLMDNKTGKVLDNNEHDTSVSATADLTMDTANFAKRSLCQKIIEKIDANQTRVVYQEWLNSEAKRVFLSSSAKPCSSESEGCRAMTDDSNIKVAPDYLKCDEKGAFARSECQRYALHCTADDVGCQLYQAQDEEEPDISAVAPASCSQDCVGLKAYILVPSFFDTELSNSFAYFKKERVKPCGAQEAGCEEFTNIDIEKKGGEAKAYFSKTIACEQTDDPALRAVFYSYYGSEQGGRQPVAYYLKADEQGNPDCAPSAECACTSKVFSSQLNQPTPIMCREFISASGVVSYRYTDKLVYQTTDCSEYRRTIGSTTRFASKLLSTACSAQAVGCRAYSSTTAGNYAVVLRDTFEREPFLSGWSSTASAVDTSREAETVGGRSLRVKAGNTNAIFEAEKNIKITANKNYKLSFNAKAEVGAKLEIFGKDSAGTEAQFDSANFISSGWQYFSFSFCNKKACEGKTAERIVIRITPQEGGAAFSQTFIDTIFLKESEGITVFAIDTSTKTENARPSACETGSGSETYLTTCRLYTNPESETKQAYSGFSKVCPLPFVGCRAFTEKAATSTLYLVDKPEARCREQDINCTAYGFPARTRTRQVTNIPMFNDDTFIELDKWTSQSGKFNERTAPKAFFLASVVDNKFTIKRSNSVLISNHSSLELKIAVKTFGTYSFFPKLIDSSGTEVGFTPISSVYPSNAATVKTATIDSIALGTDKKLYLEIMAQSLFGAATGAMFAIDYIQLAQTKTLETDIAYQPNPNDGKREQWSTVYYRITPKEISASSTLLYDGDNKVNDSQAYGNGICMQSEIGCRAYDTKSGKRYFKAPDKSLCFYRQERNSWFYKACRKKSPDLLDKDFEQENERLHPSYACQIDDDCKDLDPDIYTGKCDAEISCAPVNEKGAGGGPIGYNNAFKENGMPSTAAITYWNTYGPPTYFRQCPAQAVGCREYKDPECVPCGPGNTNCDTPNGSGTLRSDYGRLDAKAGFRGASCKPSYTYLEDVKESQNECSGELNVEKGCVLFTDTDPDAEGLMYNSRNYYDAYFQTKRGLTLNPADTVKNGTSTDSNILLKVRLDRECKTSLECASEYIEPSTNQATCTERLPCLLRNSSGACISIAFSPKKVCNEVNSFPECLDAKDCKTYGTDVQCVPLGVCVNSEGNVVKERCTQDRQCGNGQTCKQSSPSQDDLRAYCGQYGRDENECTDESECFWNSEGATSADKCQPSPAGSLARDFMTPRLVSATSTLSFSMLSGYARPNLVFAGNYTTKDRPGRDSYFDWKQVMTEIVDTPIANIRQDTLQNRLELSAEPINAVASSCRLYPRQDAPKSKLDMAGEKKLWWNDPCNYMSSKSDINRGIYGYCLEPYPQFSHQYYGDKGDMNRKVCARDNDKTCKDVSECVTNNNSSTGPCVYTGYKQSCLLWHPVKLLNQRFSGADDTQKKAYKAENLPDIYFCLATGTSPIKGDVREPSTSYDVPHKLYEDVTYMDNGVTKYRFRTGLTANGVPIYSQGLTRDTSDILDGGGSPVRNVKKGQEFLDSFKYSGNFPVFTEPSNEIKVNDIIAAAVGGCLVSGIAAGQVVLLPGAVVGCGYGALAGVIGAAITTDILDRKKDISFEMPLNNKEMIGTTEFDMEAIERIEYTIQGASRQEFRDLFNVGPRRFDENSYKKDYWKRNRDIAIDVETVGNNENVLRNKNKVEPGKPVAFFYDDNPNNRDARYCKEETITNSDGTQQINTFGELCTTTSENFIKKHESGGVECSDGKNFVAIGPEIVNNKLTGWKWRYCDESFSFSTDKVGEAVAVGITIYFKDFTTTKHHKEQTENSEYCTEFIKPVLEQASVGYFTKVGSDASAGQIGDGRGNLGFYYSFPSGQDKKFFQTGELETTPINLSAKTHKWDEDDFYKKDKYKDATNPNIAFSKLQVYQPPEESSDTNSSPPVYKDLTIGTAESLRASLFGKAYEYWTWIDNAYKKTAWYDFADKTFKYDDNTPFTGTGSLTQGQVDQGKLITMWNASRRDAQNNKAPKIFAAPWDADENKYLKPQDGAPYFDFVPSPYLLQKASIRFWVQATPDQLPLRKLIIDWGDGKFRRFPYVDSKIEGTGKNHRPGPAVGEKTTERPFEFTHLYRGSPNNRKICIYVMDNWEARAKACGTPMHTNSPGAPWEVSNWEFTNSGIDFPFLNGLEVDTWPE